MLNILYVEDDPHSRDVLALIERMYPGYMRVVIFPDSHDFADRLGDLHPPPDVFLLDIHVKPYTGFQMFEIIRSLPRFAYTPIMALTASVMNEEVAILQQAGFHGVLSKPLDIDAFADVVSRVMEGEYVWYVW